MYACRDLKENVGFERLLVKDLSSEAKDHW